MLSLYFREYVEHVTYHVWVKVWLEGSCAGED